MARRDLVVVGASAGGIEALRELVRELPLGFPASIVVVTHVAAHAPSALPSILTRSGPLRATHATSGVRLEHGHIFVAPPDHHLLVHDGALRLTRGPRENGHRPAVDPLFRSAARWHGPRVIAVVLSGALDDGTSGAFAVRMRGGIVVAQSPDDASYASMPESVIARVGADHVAPARELARLLVRLVAEDVEGALPAPPPVGDAHLEDDDMEERMDRAPSGPASAFTCPECHGALWEVRDGGDLVRYRCRVGHVYASDSLGAAHAEYVEEALWAAYRALEEAEALAERLGSRARGRGFTTAAARYDEERDAAHRRAALIRDVLEFGHVVPASGDNRRQQA
ncbi:MAG TPA: chemotaxis protein CheB [Labilithrix sp.]